MNNFIVNFESGDSVIQKYFAIEYDKDLPVYLKVTNIDQMMSDLSSATRILHNKTYSFVLKTEINTARLNFICTNMVGLKADCVHYTPFKISIDSKKIKISLSSSSH